MKHIIRYIPLMVLAVAVMFTACKDTDERWVPEGPQTYRMKLKVAINGYDGATTRATAYTFQDGDLLYLLFRQTTGTVRGTAVYASGTDEWTITTSGTLADTDESSCSIAFFLSAGSSSQNAVSLTQQTRIYTDSEATWQRSDGLLTVQGLLTPALGRIRFKGSAGQKCTVTGLAFASSFDLTAHTFNVSPSKFTATCNDEGYTPYYYATFADSEQRQLTFELSAESGLRRNFGEGVLQPGTSGYVTIPTTEDHEGWSLVNLGNGGEITFPTVEKPTASNIRSQRITLEAKVTSTGGGRLSATGFVIATHSSPTRNDRTMDCGTATTLSTTVNNLTPETTYYIRAFAQNEAGNTYSEEIIVRTIAKSDDNSDILRDEWGDDENWGDSQNSVANLDRETWPNDEDWN